MLAKVESAKAIRSPLEYNEQKVEAEQAIFLDAHNFWQEKDDLSLREKKQRFDNLTELNERSEKKILHVSVNFHPDDKLTDKEMKHISTEFMSAIDFRDQPWLVYRHIDAGHPHMHIVSTNIRRDGSRVLNDLRDPHHLIDICREIEMAHGLKAALAPHENLSSSATQNVPRLTYGDMPTRTGIEMVLSYVTEQYTFTSFESYNAVLGLYNVRADRGNPEGLMYQSHGLYYRMIDEEGKKLGAPIKASDFHMGVTLDSIEEVCKLKQSQVQENIKDRIRLETDFNMVAGVSLQQFGDKLALDQISLVIPAFTRRPTRVEAPSDAPNLFYMDWSSKTIFRDTELGQEYTAAAILQRLGLDKSIPEMVRQQQLELKPAQQSLLDNPDLGRLETRDLLFRLSTQHDKWVEAEQEQQRLTHRHGLHL